MSATNGEAPTRQSGETSTVRNVVSRRAVATGLAWSAPIVLSVSAAPAFAASPPPRISVAGKTFFNRPYGGDGVDNLERLVIYTTTPGYAQVIPAYPDWGFRILNTTTATTISNVRASFWFASRSLSFTTAPEHNAGWSRLTLDSTSPAGTYNGNSYYSYSTAYSPAVTAQAGNTALPPFAFNTPNSVRYMLADMNFPGPVQMYLYVSFSALINGVTQNLTPGYLSISSS